jgi:hypothetical protein
MSNYDEICGQCPYCGLEFESQTKAFRDDLQKFHCGDRVSSNETMTMQLRLKSECQGCGASVVADIKKGILVGLIKVEDASQGELLCEAPFGQIMRSSTLDKVSTEMQERHRTNAVWLTEATDRAVASVRALSDGNPSFIKATFQDVLETIVLTNSVMLDHYERFDKRLKELEENLALNHSGALSMCEWLTARITEVEEKIWIKNQP